MPSNEHLLAAMGNALLKPVPLLHRGGHLVENAFGEALEGGGEGGDGVSDQLGIELPGGEIEVGEVVTELMVANIVGNAVLAAKHGSLLLGLDPLGPGGDAAGGNAVADKPS